jgi:carbon storage regulator
MLVLSRKPGEAIVIGENVRLVVHRIAGGRVTLGIVAPAEVPVLRTELRPEDETISPIGPYS